jgi:outer membrane protein OmpA-like peptidoglycan-associated protein
MRVMTYRSVVVMLGLAAMASPAWAGDKEGCKDPMWAKQRPPGYEITDCSTKAWASVNADLPAGSKRLEGQLDVVTYTLTNDAKNLSSKAARDFYAAQAVKAGGKLVTAADDGYKAYLVQKSPKGDVYLLWDHGSGNEETTGSYNVSTLRIGPPPLDVVAKKLDAPLDTQAKCADPPWLVKGMPGFKRDGCDNRDLDSVTFTTKDGDKTIAGRVHQVHYTLIDESKSPVAALVAKNFGGALAKVGAKLVSSPDDVFHVVAQQTSSSGDVWYGYVHGSGSEDETGAFDLVTVQTGGPAPKACKLEIYGVNFDTDKSTLRPDADPVLGQVLAMFKADPKMAADISGHTDDQGAKDYNQKLSGQRADAVKAWLVAHGIDAARMTTHGYGMSKPLVPNTSDENRAKNRRVELEKQNCK